MELKQLQKLFPIHLPIAKDGLFWNGKPGEFSNIGFNLNWSQKFGHTSYANNSKVYGYYNGKLRGHNGNDYAGDLNTPIASPCKCWVSCVAYNPNNIKGADPEGYGNYIFYETEPMTLNGETFKLEFVNAHLSKTLVKPYTWLEEGTTIGLMGTTGMSTGVHTHFGIRPLIRKSDGSWEYMFKDEESLSFRGYVDPEPFLIETLIYDKQVLINKQKFMSDNDKKLIFNNKTGEIGWLYQGKLQVPAKERIPEMLASYLVRKEGVNISDEEWDNLDKKEF